MIVIHSIIVFIITSLAGFLLGKIYTGIVYLIKRNPEDEYYNKELKKELKKDLYFCTFVTSISGVLSYVIYY